MKSSTSKQDMMMTTMTEKVKIFIPTIATNILKNTLLLLLTLQATICLAQTDSVAKFTFSGYGELYYSCDFANPSNHEKPNFVYNHKRHNEFNANLILAKANYTASRTRANLGLMTGNYAQYNLSNEPTWAQFIYEANIGVKLSQRHNLWLDAGIMPSHIGFESAISADCWTLTRSILAENSPYFETGLKLSFANKKENLNLAFLVLNGWQRVQRLPNRQSPSFGVQINYKPTEKLQLNYSNFVGTEKPDTARALRIYHNFYMQYEPNKKLGFIGGCDIGTDKYNAAQYGVWFSPVLIARYALNKKSKIALRTEYYDDAKQIMIATNTENGFKVLGVSSNYDYQISDKAQFRIEGKIYHSADAIFQSTQKNNYSLTTNLTIRF